jgi:hypothetical protein
VPSRGAWLTDQRSSQRFSLSIDAKFEFGRRRWDQQERCNSVSQTDAPSRSGFNQPADLKRRNASADGGTERVDDTIGRIVSIESYFVELEILSVNGHDIDQECTVLSSLDELELRDTVFFKPLEAAKDHYKKVRADIASQEAGKHERGNKVVDFGVPRPKRR